MIGPASGVWLYTQFGPWGPQLASIAVADSLADFVLDTAPV